MKGRQRLPPFLLRRKRPIERYTHTSDPSDREDFTTGVFGKPWIAAVHLLLCIALMVVAARAQSTATSGADNPAASVERGLALATQGRCDEATPLLKRLPPETSKETKYKAQMAIVRCAMRRRDGQATVTALLALRHDFPDDPEVLYLTTEVFLRIAETASTDLARVAPGSYQIQKLQAESLESQSKWAEAATIYRKILEAKPNLPGIHLQLAIAALSQPELPDRTVQAKKEFEQELAIDPTNATAQFWLGDIARNNGDSDEAITRFTAATKIDASLWTAYLGMGLVLNYLGRYADAIAPLARYSAAVPDDEAGHYQLSISYRRTGRKQDADREMALHQQLLEKQKAKGAARMGATTPYPSSR